MDFESLRGTQKAKGKEIETLYSNYKKDGPKRRTETYLNNKLTELNKLWSVFSTNAQAIKPFEIEYAKDAYFEQDYFEAIEKIYNKMKTLIAEHKKTP